MLLNDKVAVVTGGGRGIGRGITDKLLEAGARVLVAQRQPLDEDLGANPRVAWCEADLGEREAPYAIARAVEAHFGGADILVNNAGFMFEKSLDDMHEDDWDRMMAVNLRAPVFLAKAHLRQHRQHRLHRRHRRQPLAYRLLRLQGRRAWLHPGHGRRPGARRHPLQRHRPGVDQLGAERCLHRRPAATRAGPHRPAEELCPGPGHAG